MTALCRHRYRRDAERKDAASAGAGCRQGCGGGLAALGGQGAGTEKRGEEAVQQSERKEV